jgi:hypothetical protein
MPSAPRRRAWRLAPWLVLALLAAALAWPVGGAAVAVSAEGVGDRPVSPAGCGPGSLPETDLQGRVPRADRDSGRSARGYRCNLELVGRYQGQGTTWVSQTYRHCAYHGQSFPASLLSDSPGVHVVDVTDPAAPRLTTTLTSPAFLGNPWESLKVNEARGLLAGAFVGPGAGVAALDVYDISGDCTAPRLLNSISAADLSVPATTLSHEGGWSPDGRTYWTTQGGPGVLTAIDLEDPTAPRVLYSGVISTALHGFGMSEDGRRMDVADIDPPGLRILDVGDVQDRAPLPQVREVAAMTWAEGSNTQHVIPVTWGGRPHLIAVDELEQGGVRIIDVTDETAPVVVNRLRLAIQMPEHADLRAVDQDVDAQAGIITAGGNGLFGYEAHYCTADRPADPTALACGFLSSGVRVFDVRDPLDVREIAYHNPPAQVGRAADLPGSEHAQGVLAGGTPAGLVDLSTDWCSSPPRFVAPDQLWVHCQDNGFMVLRFTGGAYPLPDAPTGFYRRPSDRPGDPRGGSAAGVS